MIAAVPRDAIFFFCLPDAKRTLSGIRGIEAVRILEERDIAGKWKAIVTQVQRASEGGGLAWRLMRAAGGNPLDMLGSLGEEMCLAVVRNEGPQLVFVADIGDRAEEIDALALAVAERLPEHEMDALVYRNVEVSAWVNGESCYSYANLDNLAIAATGRGTMEKVIDAAMDAGVSVRARPLHTRARKLAGEADAYFFADLAGLVDDVKALLPAELGAGLAASVDAGARKAYGFFQIESRGVRDVIRVEGEEAALPLPPVLVQKPAGQTVAAYVPLEANFYLSAQVNFTELVGILVSGAFFSENIVRLKPGVAEELEELAKGLGGEFGIARFTPLGRMDPETVVIAGLMDKEATASALDAMAAAAGVGLSREKWGETEVVRAEKGALLDLGVVKLTTFALSQDAVILGTSVSAVKKCLRHSQFGASNVTASEDFKGATENLSRERLLVAYLDPRGMVDHEYAKRLKELQQASTRRVSLWKPDSFKDHLFGLALVGAVQGSELSIESFGPLGALSSVGGWYLLKPPEAAGDGFSPKRDQLLRLTRISVGLYLYAGDFDRFPVSLAELFPNYIDTLTIFGGDVEAVEDIDGRGDFVYVPGRRLDDLGDEIVVYGKLTSSGDRKRTVLYVGGYVDTLDEGVFQAMRRGDR